MFAAATNPDTTLFNLTIYLISINGNIATNTSIGKLYTTTTCPASNDKQNQLFTRSIELKNSWVYQAWRRTPTIPAILFQLCGFYANKFFFFATTQGEYAQG